MVELDRATVLGPALSAALDAKGYTTLTPVQEAVLDPALEDRDLRITSQTGSGKTVAIGFAVRAFLAPAAEDGGEGEGDDGDAPARKRRPFRGPRVMVITPTRELAKQVEEELAWLFAQTGARVASVTGGGSYRDELRALGAAPAVVVGTPGRLLDHLGRGSLDAKGLGAVVLDEADRMLDLGFRDDLDAILEHTPEGRRTHLVSATFPRDVRALADRVQRAPAHVEGTRLGQANTDIDHVVHLVDPRERKDAIVNLLLANPDEQTLIFARTRAEVSELAKELGRAGFSVAALSGEMEQRERNRSLAAFRDSGYRALVATDVAARGIDVQDIARVIHAEPPDDADSYTHRSGRTGRAGRRGTSSILVAPAAARKTAMLLHRAGVAFRYEPVPSAEAIREASDERALAAFTADAAPGDDALDDRTWTLAKRVAAAGNATRSFARLLAAARYAGPTAPREVRRIDPPAAERSSRDPRAARRDDRAPARAPGPGARDAYAPGPRAARGDRAAYDAGPRAAQSDRGAGPRADRDAGPRADRDGGEAREREGGWVPFRVSWGQDTGADARRLMAMLCRRGAIRGSDVGAIRVGPTSSTVQIASAVAESFASAARKVDPHDPHVLVRPMTGGDSDAPGASGPERGAAKAKRFEPGADRHAPKAEGPDRYERRAPAPRHDPTAGERAKTKRYEPAAERHATKAKRYEPPAERSATKAKRHEPAPERPATKAERTARYVERRAAPPRREPAAEGHAKRPERDAPPKRRHDASPEPRARASHGPQGKGERPKMRRRTVR